MAKKNATDHKQKGKPATAKSPEKAKREATPAKSPKPPKKKGGKEQQPLNREERKKAAWQRKTERKVAQQAITEVGAKASAGLTFDQLKASGLIARPSQPPAATGPTFEQILLEVVAKQAQQFESTKPVSLPVTSEPEIHLIFGGEVFDNITIEDIVEPIGDAATRKVVMAEIHFLLEKTKPIFNAFSTFSAYCGPGILAAQSAVGELFEREPEESFLRLRAAEVVLADDDPVAVENLLEEIWGQIVELQIVAGSFEPESELEKSARLGLIDGATVDRLKKAAVKEAIRLDLAQRLAGLTASTGAPAEIDETFAALIAEAAQAAKAQQRERALFRKTMSQGLRQRKEREGRRFSSKSSEEFGDEELVQFLISHREEPGAKQALLILHLEAEIAAAEKRWTDLKSRLAAGANDPEIAVAQNATAMKDLLGTLAQIRTLHQQLEALG